MIYHTLGCRDRNTEMPKSQISLTQGWLGESHQPCPYPACHLLPVCSLCTWTDNTHTVTCSGREVPAFSGGQLLTMPRTVLVGLLAPRCQTYLESNLRLPFQRLQIHTNRLKQELWQFLKSSKYTLLSYLLLQVSF